MSNWSRREVLRSSAAVCGAAIVSGQAKSAMTFPSDPRARLAVATWPFRAEIESPTNEYRDRMKPAADLRDFVVTIPEKFAVHGIEPLSSHFSSTDARYLHELRQAIENAHMHVVNIPVENEFSFYAPEPAIRKKAVDNSKKWIDVAVAIASPSVRTSIAEPKTSKPNIDLAAESLKQGRRVRVAVCFGLNARDQALLIGHLSGR